MKEMTTAEFAKANLAALEEPVSVRRYTKTIGTFIPQSYADDTTRTLQMQLDAIDKVPEISLGLPTKPDRIAELEEEIKHLKQELAKRPEAVPIESTAGHTKKTKGGQEDPFADLPKQDREFFLRKGQ